MQRSLSTGTASQFFEAPEPRAYEEAAELNRRLEEALKDRRKDAPNKAHSAPNTKKRAFLD